MKRILVTGGAGYIGSHTCKKLASMGYAPVVFDNLSTGHADNVRWGPLWTGDIRDRAALDACIGEHQPEAVIHFAASAYVGESMVDPDLYYRNNVGGMISLLSAVRDAGDLPVVFSSSCATYGVPDALPISEQTPQQPINPYGYTKLIGERMLADHAHAYGLRYVALRYFNAAGADPEGELVERHDPETHLIPRALMAAAGQIPALEIFGDDYDTPDGTCLRDYIHVADLAEAHALALRRLETGGASLCANVGTGRPTSIREILEAIEVVTGRAVPHAFRPRRDGDPAELSADPTLAREVLGFVAKRSDLARIIADAAPGFGLGLERAA
jgi:UDP-arabinose 4-epimerase